jgi:Protein of unknown function DUF262
MSDLNDAIDQKIGEVRTDTLDLSFGEIANLYASDEFVIQPDYQRLFRWTLEQRSRMIESILLELPIPQIFVIENENGVIELIDGLQRVSSVIQFIDSTILGLEPLTLVGCDIVSDLNGKAFTDLPLTLRLRLKRSSVRTIVIKRQSSSMLRYEMFKRLNTGGSILAPQEIRNCTARMLGESGVRFYEFLQTCAAQEPFKTCTEPLSQSDREQRGDEELVLRFFAAKNAQLMFRGSVRDWLDDYMEGVLLGRERFYYQQEESTFSGLFTFLGAVMGSGAFVRYRRDSPIGGVAPAYFEAVTMGTLRTMPAIEAVNSQRIQRAIRDTVQGEEFRSFTGPGANSREKLEARIATVQAALLALSQ